MIDFTLGNNVWGIVMLGLGFLNYYCYTVELKNEEERGQLKDNLYELRKEIDKEIQKKKIDALYGSNISKPTSSDSEKSE